LGGSKNSGHSGDYETDRDCRFGCRHGHAHEVCAAQGVVLTAAKSLNPVKAVVVHGPDMANVRDEAKTTFPRVSFVEQTKRLGTGHAVLMAQEALNDFSGTVVVLAGDVPLIAPASLSKLLGHISEKTDMAVLGFQAANPFGYGRLIVTRDDRVLAIREQKDASPAEREISLCNSGIIAIDNQLLWQLLPKVKPNNAQGEIYLTDLVELVNQAGRVVALETCSEDETQGVNDRVQLSQIEARLQAQYRQHAMQNGATLIDPATTYFSADTVIGSDVVIEPNVFFGPGTKIGNGVRILANCHIEGTTVEEGAVIGPFARLRPGAEIGTDAHIGNFVEVKKSKIGRGAKANHLTYIGDAVVGAKSNIGAGTITCNYDGYEKHLTEIGEHVFVGSNSSLVAPVKIGAGANIAAGTVVSKDVPGDALGIARAAFEVKEGWAKTYRAVRAARKAEKTSS
jgi:bifunctional UDP-N-acetylglucosamine pyrophosphorylase / glucosamine-1-phosphate N-acetyltransferase